MESQVDNQLENSVNFPYWGSKKQGKFKKSSPAPQFENINSLALRLLYVQLSHPYMTTRKTIALTIWTFVSKVMSLHFNKLYSKARRSYGFKWVIREELFVKVIFKLSLEEVKKLVMSTSRRKAF